MAPVLHIRLLGDCSLCYDGAPAVTEVNTPRLQSLLAYLLLHRAAPQSRSHVAFQFWPDSTEAQAHSNLRTLLHRLRQALPDADQFISVEGQTLQWRQEVPYTLDVAAFEQAVSRAERTGEEAARRAALERAIELYGGELLPSCYDDWILPQRERLHQAYVRAMEQLIQLLEEEREYDQALRYAQRLLRDDPLHEAGYRRLMRLRALSGDRAGALRVYHDCVTVLQRELGVEPSPATQRAYERVLRVEPGPESETRTTPLVSPLVGRETEWAGLRRAWRRSARGPRFALVLGEAGIGKTRLVEELLHWAQRRGIECAYARCYAAEGELAYAPVSVLLRARPLPALDDVWLSEVARLLPEVLGERPDLPAPQPMTERWQRLRLFEALARAVLREGQPTLLVIDDLHWCDPETLDWLHFLLRFDVRARLLVVGTCRPEELDEDCPFAAALPVLHRDVRLAEIKVGPLNNEETAALASNVAREELDPAAAGNLYRETEGNPLFVVETVRAALRSEGRGLILGDGELEAGQQTSAMEVLPPRVQAVLATRLGQLSPPARELAGLAAIIGRAFTVPVLQAAGNGDEDALVRGLDELWQRRIVRERGVDAYDFSHDKLREAAYDALSPARRRLLHRQVAQALETTYASDPDAVARRLAAHYERAGLLEKAIPCYLRAGGAANRVFASDEADASFRRGLVLLAGGSWSPDQEVWRREMAVGLYEGLGDVLKSVRADEALNAYQSSLEAIDEDDRLVRARLQCKIGFSWAGQGQFDRALRVYDQAESYLGQEPFPPIAEWWQAWGDVQGHRSHAYYCMGRWREMARLLEKQRPTVERYGTVRLRGYYLSNRVIVAMRRDRYVISDETLADARAWLAITLEMGDRFWIEWSHYQLGWLHVLRGEFEEAEEYLLKGLTMVKQTRNLWVETYVLNWLAVLWRKRGQVQEARRYAEQGLMTAPLVHQLEQVALARANLAWVAWREGDVDEAQTLAQAALDSWQRSQFVHAFHWTARWPLLAMALEGDRLSETLEHARAMLDPRQQKLPQPLESALEESTKRGDDGRPDVLRACLQRAVELAQELGYL